MKFKVWVAGAAVVLAFAGVSFYFKPHDVAFNGLHDAQAKLAALGYHCTSDAQNGQIGVGFMISREAIAWHDVGTLNKSRGMGPQWHGKVWVTLNPQYWRLEAVPEETGVRVWGSVIAYGDDEVLNEIDDAF